MNELAPQVKTLLEQIQAKAAQRPAPSVHLSATERIVATRQLRSTSTALRYPLEPVSKIEDFNIPSPAGKIPVRLYVPHTEGPVPTAAPVFVHCHG